MGNEDDHPDIYFIELQKIDLTNTVLKGRVLDIGGGGEGVIGLLKGSNVIAIDKLKNELEEAPPGDYLKIIMDAKDLKFLDETFDTVTVFFTFLCVPLEERSKIFEELYRVLKKDGELVIWDLIFPKKDDSIKKFFGAYFEITIKDNTISTGYAARWNKQQDLNHFINLGEKVGFKVIEQEEDTHKIFIRFKK